MKRALDVRETARADAQVDRAIEAASDAIDGGTRRVGGLLKRRFYPEDAVRYFDWPNRQTARSWRLWLDQHELVSLTTLVSGGTTIPADGYFLYPDSGPPYNRIEMDLSSTSAFAAGATTQRAIVATGTWGYGDDTTPAGQLAGALDATQTSVAVTDSAAVDVGDLLLVDGERLLVTGRAMADTGQTVSGALTGQASDTSVTVSGGTWAVDETILIDSERMRIVDVAGTTLTVRRAWDGSVLATHADGAAIYAPRTLTVTRAATGSTAATHTDGTDVDRYVYPGLVRRLAIAYALDELLQESSGYAREVGSGDNAREASGRGIRQLEQAAVAAFGRQARTRAV